MSDHPSPVRGFGALRAPRAGSLSLLAAAAVCLVSPVRAEPSVERVRGFFCNGKSDYIAFLVLQAKGENEEMAANAVNKSIAKFSCAYFMPAKAIHTGEHTVMEDGLVFKLQSYLFLPEKVERWSGTVFGSLQTSGPSKADI
jgi:hypothetical protein